MTWQTPDGDRILVQEEAALVREGVALIVNQIHDNIRFGQNERLWDFDVRLFDQLPAAQQLETMQTVSHHLLTDTDTVAELTAINEAAVLAIYQAIVTEIEIEIDTEHESAAIGSAFVFFWRKRAAYACHEMSLQSITDDVECSVSAAHDANTGTPNAGVPNVRCSDAAAWREAIESLASHVLWEREFEVRDEFDQIETAETSTESSLYDTLDFDYRSENEVAENSIDESLVADEDQIRSLTQRKPR